jgi:hypothetical protein
MKVMYALVIIILIISVVLTLLVTGKGDANYSSSTKRNTTNLALIYAIVIILALIALGIFIKFFT